MSRGTLRAVVEVFLVAMRLGLTSFGGPIAHLGYFRHEYVVRRRWLDETAYVDLVALCQTLPGPASSELGIAIGTLRAGPAGGVAAWLGFTVPSAIALVAFALATTSLDVAHLGWVHGLKLAAVAVVAQAVVGMWRSLATDWRRRMVAVAAGAIALVVATPLVQVLLIVAGAMVGRLALRAPAAATGGVRGVRIGRGLGVAALALLGLLLVGLPLLVAVAPSQPVRVADAFYRSGALVFGGGHVVLPLLHEAVVPPGWITDDQFLAGYGAAQAVPGPLFTFAAYLGAALGPWPNGVAGAVIALIAIFLPAFLLVWGILPFWDEVRGRPGVRRAMAGTNAAVIGLLAAALYGSIWVPSVTGPLDAAIAAAGFTLLVGLRAPPWVVVVLAALAGQVIAGG